MCSNPLPTMSDPRAPGVPGSTYCAFYFSLLSLSLSFFMSSEHGAMDRTRITRSARYTSAGGLTWITPRPARAAPLSVRA